MFQLGMFSVDHFRADRRCIWERWPRERTGDHPMRHILAIPAHRGQKTEVTHNILQEFVWEFEPFKNDSSVTTLNFYIISRDSQIWPIFAWRLRKAKHKQIIKATDTVWEYEFFAMLQNPLISDKTLIDQNLCDRRNKSYTYAIDTEGRENI